MKRRFHEQSFHRRDVFNRIGKAVLAAVGPCAPASALITNVVGTGTVVVGDATAGSVNRALALIAHIVTAGTIVVSLARIGPNGCRDETER